MLPSRGALLWAALAICATAAWDNKTRPSSFYYSRPDLIAPAMKVTHRNEAEMTDGYVFITPYQQPQAGPYIYDKRGNLVWSGFADIGPFNAHNFYPCQYQGKLRLCMFQGNQLFGYARGHAIIMDEDYKIIKTVESVGDTPPLDQHEFRLINDGETALVTIYQQEAYDLSRIPNFPNKDIGWVTNSIFQEINVTDNSLIFEWRSLDHVEPWGTYVYPETSDISGSGTVPTSPWDYFHINSVDKSKKTGNYIISARHMGKIYNIDAKDGHIIWTLEAGGKTDFTCIDFAFSFQHDAEIQYEDDKIMNISFYDNASNNHNRTNNKSSGKFVTLNFEDKTAKLYRTNTHHPEGMLSASQGNTQVLENGNVFHSFGSWPRFTEHNVKGETVWAGRIGPGQGQNMVYRAYSGPWKSVPKHTKPALWTFSKRSDAPLAFYVSWNGCTEVQSWKFYGANDMQDTFSEIGTTDRRGFETRYRSETHFKFTFAEAISYDGESLKNSSIIKTWVPGPKLAPKCNEWNCRDHGKKD